MEDASVLATTASPSAETVISQAPTLTPTGDPDETSSKIDPLGGIVASVAVGLTPLYVCLFTVVAGTLTASAVLLLYIALL